MKIVNRKSIRANFQISEAELKTLEKQILSSSTQLKKAYTIRLVVGGILYFGSGSLLRSISPNHGIHVYAIAAIVITIVGIAILNRILVWPALMQAIISHKSSSDQNVASNTPKSR
jgi:hypothetical protein